MICCNCNFYSYIIRFLPVTMFTYTYYLIIKERADFDIELYTVCSHIRGTDIDLKDFGEMCLLLSYLGA